MVVALDVKSTVDGLHTADGFVMLNTGVSSIITRTVSVLIQPDKSAVTVYNTLLTDGVNATLSVTPLSQLIVAPSGFEAVKVILVPEHALCDGPASTVGAFGSVNVAVDNVDGQPFKLTPIFV